MADVAPERQGCAKPPHVASSRGYRQVPAGADGVAGYASLLGELIRNSGIYAVAAMAAPLVSLVLSPLLTRQLSRPDYGALAVLSTVIALVAGVTQLSLGSSFFRAYGYDYEAKRDQLDVLSTVVVLLALVATPTAALGIAFAPWMANALLGQAAYANAVRLAAMVILVQNLTVPGFAWLRAERRAGIYSFLSILNLVVVLGSTVLLVGALHRGITGALVATGAGYGIVVVITLPVIVRRAGLHLRSDIVRNLMTFGLPLVANVVTIWVLQLSDRLLLSRFGSLAQTASYDVAYKIGGVISPLILSPFQLAWPVAMFAIAKRDDAPRFFRRVFRWYGVLLLFATYALSLIGIATLHLLFPPSYQSAAPIIPVIGLSLMFFGLTLVIAPGPSIRRKTWLGALCVALAALVNLGLNIVSIPRFGAMAAALSTLAAYFVLAVSGYIVNQLIYPVPFEIGRLFLAFVVGVAIYGGCSALMDLRPGLWGWAGQAMGLAAYGAWLFFWAGGGQILRSLRGRSLRFGAIDWMKQPSERQTRVTDRRAEDLGDAGRPGPVRVCMHVLGTARTDVRVLREARTLAGMGLAISIVDVERVRAAPRREDLGGVTVRHIVMPSWFLPTRFKPWFLTKAARLLVRGTVGLWRTPADLYHAHDYNAFPACYLAARLRRKPLIFDAHELPLADPNVTRWRLLCSLFVRVMRSTIPRCAGVITVSPPIAEELERRFGGPPPAVIRNIPPYRAVEPSDHLRRRLDLATQTRIALYQGNLQDDRGLATLVSAGRFVDPAIVIVIMGRGPLWTDLGQAIERDGVGDRVKLLPPVPYAELLSWTASADLGLIVNPASYSRNVEMCLPNKLFEYLMAGVPVLSSRLPAVEAVFGRYHVGRVVEPLEPHVLGRAIGAMLADRDGLERMRRNALAAAQHELKWEVEQQRLIDLYRPIVATLPGRRVGKQA